MTKQERIEQPPVERTTHGVRVAASAFFLPQHSQPDREEFVFGYRMTITNENELPIRILHRHWDIIDGEGRRETVDGQGVVGRQPVIDPATSFRYSSFTRIGTHWGTMEGHYTVRLGKEQELEIPIPRFMLTDLHQADTTELVSRELV
ncbi:MAG: Co2+/Mg2+ efflux protein ApaG [Phycisphaeraceae bacterium]|nr:Co2+/Mg2+ efflux protein ApaG [Phycisphaeraceae bacterium]